MKVKCKENVQDKNNGKWYVANKVYDLSKERAEEVVKAHNGRYFEFVQETEVKEETEVKKTAKKSTK